MLNRRLVVSGLLCLSLIQSSCVSTEKKPATNRTVASESPLTFVNPQTNKTFWQEFQEVDDFKITNPKTLPLLKPKLSKFGTWVRANPVATFKDVLQNAPVLRLESLPIKDAPYKFNDTVVVSRYKDVTEVLDNPKIFTVRNYSKRMADSVGPFMLAYDGSRYSIQEKPWMRQMMPPSDWPKIRQMVRSLVQDAIKAESYIGTDLEGRTYGRLELVNSVARRVPIQLSGAYFGFPGPSMDKMYEWSRATQDDFFHNVKNEPVVAAAAIKAGKEMHAYLKELIAQRQQAIAAGTDTSDDVMSRLIRSKVNDFVAPTSPEDDRLRTNIIGTLVGGVETTQAAIVQSINEMLKRPEIFEQARQAAIAGDVDTVAKYVWEALRFHPVNPFVVRFAEQDYTLKSGETIKKGSHVLVATQAAMLDSSEEGFENPLEFRLDRPQKKFFHLGYGHHRCLGDYVAEIEVPEIVMAILKLPGLRRASGYAGEVDFRKRASGNIVAADETSVSFPESFSVVYDAAPSDRKAIEIANSKYSYEDYIMDFDREEYRKCLAGLSINDKPGTPFRVTKAIIGNLKVHKINSQSNENRDLLFCRINKPFRACMLDAAKKGKFGLLESGEKHTAAYKKCMTDFSVSINEDAFYRHVMLGQPLDVSQLNLRQAQRTTNADWQFEDVLKFYDRFTYRECFMNPAGLSSFPKSRDMMMYARFNIGFRLCLGKPALKHKYTGGLLGEDRETMYEKCKDGVYNEKTFKKEDGLSREEKYYYETLVLGRKVKFSDIK